MPPGMIMTQAGMQPQYQCINPGNPYSDVEVGMPDEEIDPAVCAKMGIPEVCPSRAYSSRASAWPLSGVARPLSLSHFAHAFQADNSLRYRAPSGASTLPRCVSSSRKTESSLTRATLLPGSWEPRSNAMFMNFVTLQTQSSPM